MHTYSDCKYSTLAVFGFNQTEFKGLERGGPYAVELGFLSGRSTAVITVFITLNFGTAGNSIGFIVVYEPNIQQV